MKTKFTTALCIVIVFVTCFTETNAQSLFHCGPMLGIGYRTTSGSGEKSPGIGGYVGLVTNFRLHKSFSLEPTFSYSQKGFYYLDTDILDGGDEIDLTLNYFVVNLPFKYTSPGGFYISAGPQTGILMGAQYDDSESGGASGSELKKHINTFDYGIFAGAGYQFKNGLALNLNAEIGMRKLLKDGADDTYDYAFLSGKNIMITTGIYYLIGYGKKPGAEKQVKN